MENEPKVPPEETDATIVEFPKTEMQRSIERHPAKGRETPVETLARLSIVRGAEEED